MFTITKRLEWDAGHRIVGHMGKCRHLHGHRYAAEITLSVERLDSLSMVADFGMVKEEVGGWIDENWDHRTILSADDPLLGAFVTEDRTPFLMPLNEQPTAECLAQYLCKLTHKLLPAGVCVQRVRVYETPTCWADYSA